MHRRWVKGALVVVGAMLLSTLGIFASDALQGIDGSLGNLANVRNAGLCTAGSVPLKIDGNVVCVDIYEASPSQSCPHTHITNIVESEENTNAHECYAASVKGVRPWNYVSLPQAQRMCAGAGKRLPTSNEWFQIALGTRTDTCAVRGVAAADTGSSPECVSTTGAYDVVGNMWEWVDETVVGNTFHDRPLPSEGYVSSVDADGVAVTSDSAPSDLYGKDYFWSKEEGVYGMIRGGFYGSDDDAGLYTINASVMTSFAAQGVGFRCVDDVL